LRKFRFRIDELGGEDLRSLFDLLVSVVVTAVNETLKLVAG
jgi:hypothetical protein